MHDSLKSLMELCQLEAGAVVIRKQVVNLDELLNRLITEYRLQAEVKGILIKYRHSHCYVDSDPILLERVLRNLISNAIKYTGRR